MCMVDRGVQLLFRDGFATWVEHDGYRMIDEW